MSWKKLKTQYSIIVEKIKYNKSYAKDWKQFETIALNISKNPPPAVSAIQSSLELLGKRKLRHEIKILDHGCGAGLKVIYLAILGYNNIYGVNVNFDVFFINKILKSKFKINEARFVKTKGKEVPFRSNFFDFIISSQVVEHLTNDEVFLYYAEEGRVLKKNGLAYHEVPHKYIPYESHSRLWLVHLFPYFCKPFLYGLLISFQKKKNLFFRGNYYAEYFSKKFLILRTPYFHKKMIVQNIGSFKDLTYERLLSNSDFSSYDNDSPLKLRKLIQKVFALPLLGRLFVFVFKNFFILQTLSKKE